MDSICPNVNTTAQQREELNLDLRRASEDSAPQVSSGAALIRCLAHAPARGDRTSEAVAVAAAHFQRISLLRRQSNRAESILTSSLAALVHLSLSSVSMRASGLGGTD